MILLEGATAGETLREQVSVFQGGDSVWEGNASLPTLTSPQCVPSAQGHPGCPSFRLQ